MKQTAVIGAGVMGETLLSGLVRAGRRVDQLLVGEKRPSRADELVERYGVAVVSNVEAATKADTVALVVKPQDMAEVLDEIAGSLRPGQTYLLSVEGDRAFRADREMSVREFAQENDGSFFVVTVTRK